MTSPATARRPRARPLAVLLLLVAIAGSISTVLWIGAAQIPHPRLSVFSRPALFSLALCVSLTSINLMLRWFRWHFLIRRFTRRIVTRDSLAIYLATLPAIVTPFFVGELVRVLILRKKAGSQTAHLAWVWLIERILDAAVLVWLLLAALSPRLGLGLLPVLAGVALLLFRLLLEDRRIRNVATIGAVTLITTTLAWLLPALALAATLAICGRAVPFAVGVKAFSAGTLSGGVSGLPLGVSIAGSTMIEELLAAGVAANVGVLAILISRIGTSWFAVFLGLAAFLLWRARLAGIMRDGGSDHFDLIAHEYEEQIPKHIRDRLLAKKTGLIQQRLWRQGISGRARGLDVGCGQGWYLAELARAGYRMHGVDFSGGQLRKAAVNLAADDVGTAPLAQADAQRLPFPDDTFDFAYSINAFHHLPSPEAQARAIGEIARVLRPGGIFVLHEINTHNPVFRLYVGYLFPLLKQIDEGTERWILPSALPPAAGARWAPEVQYFTFTPDFVPRAVQRLLDGVERRLERSALQRYSAHYQACLLKNPTG
jgi:SAM-dependent methyltransferase